MSLRLRLLLVIAAVNVGLLLLVVWLGLETAAAGEQISPRALVDAFRAVQDPEMVALPPSIKYVVRLPRGGDEFEGIWPKEAEAEVRQAADRLKGLVDEGGRVEYDGDGLYRTVLTLKRLPESDAVRTWIGSLVHRLRDDRRP